MPRVRAPGDPWYTAIYRDPHRLWWAPPLFLFAILLLARRAFGDEGWGQSLLLTVIPAVLYMLFGGLRHWNRRRP